MLRKILPLIFVIFVQVLFAQQEKRTISGFVFNRQTGKALPGATIRIPNTNTGTYSSSRGFFRLKVPVNISKIKVSSIGHKSKTVELQKGKDTLFVYLDEIPVKKEVVTVTGDIEANEVIKRAIAQKEDNLNKLKTFIGRLYTKMVIELDGSLFVNKGAGNNILLGGNSKNKENPEKYRLFLFETFSDVFIDYEKNITHTDIIQRHQTKNLDPKSNLVSIAKFVNFYEDRVKIVDVEFTTPLSEDAFSYYNFKIIGKQPYDDKYIYIISVTPKTRLYPAFTGTLKLLEGSYNLIEIDLQPSENTAIALVDSLKIKEKYTESVEKVWYPSYLEFKGKVNFEAIKGLLTLQADFNATSIYSDVKINKPLPDSIYTQEKKYKISVAPDADSTKIEFWENNALREITDREKEIYNRIDSLVAKDSTNKKSGSNAFDWSLWPYADFNRVSSVSVGIAPSFGFYDIGLKGYAAYSFGMNRVIFQADLSYKFHLKHQDNISLGIKIFSKPTRLSLDRSYSRLLNTSFAGLFHYDYYDYMRSDGFAIYSDINMGIFEITPGFEMSKQSSLPRTTNKSIFVDKEWRQNPEINEGDYSLLFLHGTIGNVNYITMTSDFENELDFSTLMGKEKEDNNVFYAVTGKYKTSIPLFYTGYKPIKLFLALEGGYNSDLIPMQYLNKMQSSMLFITKFGNFLTPPPAEYGGREYYAAHIALNLGDLWWRFLHLPLYEGRGLNLILAGSYSRFFSKGESIYNDTGRFHYSEIGFGFTRIPTFISNIFYLSLDARWGIGPIASGRFAVAASISFPF